MRPFSKVETGRGCLNNFSIFGDIVRPSSRKMRTSVRMRVSKQNEPFQHHPYPHPHPHPHFTSAPSSARSCASFVMRIFRDPEYVAARRKKPKIFNVEQQKYFSYTLKSRKSFSKSRNWQKFYHQKAEKKQKVYFWYNTMFKCRCSVVTRTFHIET